MIRGVTETCVHLVHGAAPSVRPVWQLPYHYGIVDRNSEISLY